ncbi:fructosamine kinase family protein [Rhodovulum sp. DZ06]|uniref:fructosamine kinase family protein n=1 Tax=Rhodovulum sp. DZ06 TaxID=3425126 RepID=UPI003D3596DB
MTLTAADLAAEAAAALGERVVDARPLAGGDLNLALLVRCESGREMVVKSGPAPRVEGEMLSALRAAGAPAPAVLGATPHALALERLDHDGAGLGPEGWAELGRALRALHDAPAPAGAALGWPEDYAFSGVAIPGAPAADWPSFWAERRLAPSLPHLPADLALRVERVAATLPDRLPAAPLSLLHGDLWVGNLLAAGGRFTALIDPACCYGDGEADLAMLNLFGAPGEGFAEAYGPLAPGAGERRAVYQLWPAIVHVRLFGAGYHGLLDRILRAAGA